MCPAGIHVREDRGRELEIDPDADDHGGAGFRPMMGFGKHAAELAVPCDDVVRPLQFDIIDAGAAQRAHGCHADRKGQRRQVGRPAPERVRDRQAQARPGR